jgi:hypothetical protein
MQVLLNLDPQNPVKMKVLGQLVCPKPCKNAGYVHVGLTKPRKNAGFDESGGPKPCQKCRFYSIRTSKKRKNAGLGPVCVSKTLCK